MLRPPAERERERIIPGLCPHGHPEQGMKDGDTTVHICNTTLVSFLIHPSLCASTHTGVSPTIARGMSLDYHDVHPDIPSVTMGISSLFPLCTAVPGTPRPSLPGTQRRWSCLPAPEPCTGRRCHVPEPLHRQLSQEHPQAFAIGIHDVLTGPPYEGELGEGLLFRTDRGDIQAILHQAPAAQYGVIWHGGARGGFDRPGQGAYARLADVLRRDRISSLRLSYRHPNVLPECARDVMAGIAYLTYGHIQPVVLVGHSFGGAVVITAGALHAHVAGVVALAPQTYGLKGARDLCRSLDLMK